MKILLTTPFIRKASAPRRTALRFNCQLPIANRQGAGFTLIEAAMATVVVGLAVLAIGSIVLPIRFCWRDRRLESRRSVRGRP